MDLVTIGLGVLCLLGAVLGKLLMNELAEWSPVVARLIIKRAAAKLPPDVRERYHEEWLADLAEFPGKLFKLWRAVGCARSATILSRSLRQKSPANEGTSGTPDESPSGGEETITSQIADAAAPLPKAFDTVMATLDNLLEIARCDKKMSQSVLFLEMTRLQLQLDHNGVTDHEFEAFCEKLENGELKSPPTQDRPRQRRTRRDSEIRSTRHDRQPPRGTSSPKGRRKH